MFLSSYSVTLAGLDTYERRSKSSVVLTFFCYMTVLMLLRPHTKTQNYWLAVQQ